MADSLSRLADAAAVALFGDAARRLPFAVTPRMKEIASTTAAPARSLIVAAYIVGTGVLHSRGTFSATLRGEGAARNASLLGLVDAMVARSPGLCAPGTSLVIVHNVDVADGLRGGVVRSTRQSHNGRRGLLRVGPHGPGCRPVARDVGPHREHRHAQRRAERNALNALIKVVAPTLYATLFTFGSKRGAIGLPFFVTSALLASSALLAATISYEEEN